MPKQDHAPERTCIGCMRRDFKPKMVRIVLGASGPTIDEAARMPGRGGYLHRRAECLERFERSKIKEFRSLRRALALDERRKIAELIRTRLDSK
jgi:predicted RNA-binding protein YlxR (DUF448 family)